MDDNARDFYYVLYTTLLANSPRDTGNMVTNITLTDFGTFWLIRISGPRMSANGYYDYAKAVNYNPQRTPKEARNYQWVERSIKQVSHLFGKEVRYELS
jgi:hypothetical protein